MGPDGGPGGFRPHDPYSGPGGTGPHDPYGGPNPYEGPGGSGDPFGPGGRQPYGRPSYTFPPGAVPPGARFDPVMPFGPQGVGRGRPSRGGRGRGGMPFRFL